MITNFTAADDFRVNTVVTDEQDYPRAAALEDGRFVIVWRSGWAGSIAGQIYERDGTPVGTQFRISDWGVHPLSQIGVTGLPGGGFAVAWSGAARSDANDSDVLLQIFDGAGARSGAAVVVNQVTASSQLNPAVTLLASGNFVVTWDQMGGTGSTITSLDVKGQIFSPTGARVGSEFMVNTTTAAYQQISSVTALADGGFVVTWHDNSSTNPYGDYGFTGAQVFSDTGAKVGSEFRVNTVATNDQRGATVAALSNGGFVVAWTDTSGAGTPGAGYYAKFQLFTAGGAKVGGEVTIDTSGTSTYDSVRVAELAGGGFLATWVGEVWSGGYILSSQLFGQVYDESGQAAGSRLTLSAASPYHWDATVESLADGSFVVTYQRNGNAAEGWERDVHARLFTAVRSGDTVHGTAADETFAGGDLDDFLGGYGGGDTLTGGAGADMLDGGAGDDQLDGGADADRLTGGAGNDQVAGGTGADILDGGIGDDELDGGADSDRLMGGAGNDRLDGGSGADRMTGGMGDDVYIVDDAADTVVEVVGQGTDEVRTALASFVIPVGVERLTGLSSEGQALTGGSGADTITGGSGDDALSGLGGDDVLDGGAGADIMTGGAGNDIYLIDPDDSVIEAAGGGTDEIRTAAAAYTLAVANVENLRGLSDLGQALTGDEGDNRIEGAAGADVLVGAGGTDRLIGGGGDDMLSGGGGNDVVEGGTGADSLDGGDANDTLDGGAGSDALTGGDGNDVLKFSAATGSGDVDTVDGGSGLDVLVASFAAATDPAGLRYSIVDMGDGSYSGWYAQGAERVEFSGIEAFQINGSAFDDHLLGGARADYLFGGAGNDLIEGGGGNDLIVGADGSDTLIGGAGNDQYVVSDLSDTIVELEDGGIDQVDASTASYTLGANLENLAGTASGPQTLTGNGLANRIVALGGASLLHGAGGDDVLEGGNWGDTLDGGTGADTMRGGGGDDIYLVDDAGDVVVDTSGWSDEIRTALPEFTLTLASGVETLTGTASTGQTLTGTTARNTLNGGSGDDRLFGMGGGDILLGGAGADHLDTGIYAGYMFGGTGNDTYVADYAGESITEYAGEGTDLVLTNLSSFTLPAHVELLTGTVDTGQNLRGNSGDNVVTGGGGNDIIRLFDAGADSAFGGSGDDAIFFGTALTAADRADGGAGTDTLALQGTYSALTLSAQHLTGIEIVQLLARTDTRFGTVLQSATSYVLTAADAALAAGATLTIDAAGLAANETLTFNGAAELDGRFVVTGGAGMDILTGGAGSDVLSGGAGADRLDGGAGADRLAGGLGNDIYEVDDAGDVVIENSGEGIDEVRTSLGGRSDYAQMYRLPDHVENLTGTSAGAQGVYGNALDNIVTMGAGGDLIVMHDGGDDSVFAGGGNDFIHFGNALTAADRIDGGAGYDTVGLIGSYTLTLSATSLTAVEKFALYSNGDASGATANNYNMTMHDGNVASGQTLMVVAQSLLAHETLVFDGSAETDGKFNIRGGRGNDTITGGGQADQIWGGLGADTLRGGGGRDAFEYLSVAESTAQSRDTILDFTQGDRINLVAIDADGNAANGNGAFSFIGASAFTGTAGQLRATQIQGNDWLIEADTNGDGNADLVIGLTTTDADPITAADFWL
jgi:Ca2+-binding RTX toxin-like protein